jgi:hypothetical protein
MVDGWRGMKKRWKGKGARCWMKSRLTPKWRQAERVGTHGNATVGKKAAALRMVTSP